MTFRPGGATASPSFTGPFRAVLCGDSNHVGFGTELVSPAPPGALTSRVFHPNGTWVTHVESVTPGAGLYNQAGAVYAGGPTNGQVSYFGALATLIMNNVGVSCEWVPCALGSTTLGNWYGSQTLGSSPIHYNENFLLDTAGLRARDADGLSGSVPATGTTCMLFECGTNGGGTNYLGTTYTDVASYEAGLNTIVDDWYTYHGGPVVLCLAAECVGALAYCATATQNVINSNPHAIAGPDFRTLWAPEGLHYLTTPYINAAALAMYNALNTAFFHV